MVSLPCIGTNHVSCTMEEKCNRVRDSNQLIPCPAVLSIQVLAHIAHPPNQRLNPTKWHIEHPEAPDYQTHGSPPGFDRHCPIGPQQGKDEIACPSCPIRHEVPTSSSKVEGMAHHFVVMSHRWVCILQPYPCLFTPPQKLTLRRWKSRILD